MCVLLAPAWAREIPVSRWVSPDASEPSRRADWIRGKSVGAQLHIEPAPGLTSLATDVLVVVNTDLYPLISTDLAGYVSDLENDGYSPTVLTCDDVQGPLACDSLRSVLATYHQDGLEGAVFIGDLPISWFQMLDDFDGDSVFEDYEEFPCDLFYMDLDGEWLDTLMWDGFTFQLGSDGMFDVHTGEVTPEIWVGRLVPSAVGAEDSLLHIYFQKDSTYREDGFGLPKRALAFVDDDWVWWAGEWSVNIGLSYPEVITIADSESTIADNYRTELTQGYEWISVFAHSWPGGHGFKYAVTEWTWFYAYEVPTIDPQANFYNLFACSNARYTEDGNMGCMYIFAETYGLGAIGTTKTGSMLNFDEFYYPLGKGATIGEAFRDWFIARGSDGYESWESSWFYGMAFLGDPTLRVAPSDGVGESVTKAEPPSFQLLTLAPNPFTGSTTIRYRLSNAALQSGQIKVFDSAGRVVRVFEITSPEASIRWDGRTDTGERVPSGMYVCRLECGDQRTTESVILVR